MHLCTLNATRKRTRRDSQAGCQTWRERWWGKKEKMGRKDATRELNEIHLKSAGRRFDHLAEVAFWPFLVASPAVPWLQPLLSVSAACCQLVPSPASARRCRALNPARPVAVLPWSTSLSRPGSSTRTQLKLTKILSASPYSPSMFTQTARVSQQAVSIQRYVSGVQNQFSTVLPSCPANHPNHYVLCICIPAPSSQCGGLIREDGSQVAVMMLL